jgi:Flp pilus assembly protein TadG
MRAKEQPRGFVLVMVSLVLVILIGFVALGVDAGVAYSGRTSAQAAADAGALAGAFTFVVHGAATEDEVRAKAMAAANVNKIMGQPVTITAGDVDVDMNLRRVTVRVNREVQTFFAKALGIGTMNVGTVGVAEAGVTPTAAYCLKPFVIPNTAVAPGNPCDACAAGQVLIDDAGKKTAYATSMMGTQFTLKPQNPANAWVSSNFMAVEISGPGSDNYRDDIAGCTGIVVKCGDLLNVQTGNMVGPTRQGILGGGQAGDGLLGSPADKYWGVADYGPNHTDTSRALVVAPLWNSCLNDQFKTGSTGECPATSLPSGGNTQYKVNGYALIFIEGVDNGADGGVVGRFIDVFGCDAGLGSVTQPGPYALPVRLIRP